MLAFARLIGNREINVMLNMIVLLRDPGSIPLSFIVLDENRWGWLSRVDLIKL